MKKLLALTALFLLLPVFAFADEIAPTPAVVNSVAPFQLSYANTESAIGFALTEKGAGQNVSATISAYKTGPLYSYNKPLSVEIHSLQFDKESSRWSANLMFLSGGEVVSAMPVSGRFEDMIEVPVLKREARNGDVISGQDIELRLFPLSHTRTDTISDMASLIGKSPVRSISPGRPIREAEVANPAAVKKSAMVEIRFNANGMELSTTGEAMNDGAKGDVISVRNTTSKKIIRATVEDANIVTVSPPELESSQLTGVNSYAAN